MTMQPKSRVQAGVREGGQFATERRAEPSLSLPANVDPAREAARLGAAHVGPVDLDNGQPFDIYDLFEQATGRAYSPREHPEDEELVLVVASEFEQAAAHEDDSFGDMGSHLCDEECGDPTHPRDGRVVPEQAAAAATKPELVTEPERDWGSVSVTEGSHTPWGPVEHFTHVAPGIARVETSSHGGIRLSEQRNEQVPSALRTKSGWYEEDCEAYIAMWAFSEEFADSFRARNAHGKVCDPKWERADSLREDAARSVRDWFPDQWEKATGEAVTTEQSAFRAREQNQTEHATSLVVVASSHSQYDRPDVVTVRATVGAKRPHESDPQDVRVFEVPASEFNDPDRKGPFIIDPQRHVDVTGSAHARV